MHRLLALVMALHWFVPELWSSYCTPPIFCHMVQRQDVIFTGVAVERLDRTTRYRVERAFKGVSVDANVDVENPDQTFFSVTLGQQYLVFAGRLLGRMSALPCIGVWNISDAEEPLRYLEQWEAGKTPTQVIGQLTLAVMGRPDVYRRFQRVTRSAALDVVGEDGTRIRTRTDAQGDFIVTVPKPGRYKLSAAIPRWVSERHTEEVLVPEHGCVVTRLALRPDGQVTGQAIGANGAPAAGVSMTMVALDGTGYLRPVDRNAATDAQGRFVFRGVLPGRYHVGVNPGGDATAHVPYKSTVYTDPQDGTSPATITVGWFEKVALGALRLPPRLGTRTIRVTVTTSDGQPLQGVTVSYAVDSRRRTSRVWLPHRSSPISFEALSGLGYIVTVRPLNREMKEFRVAPGKEPAELRVVFDKP